MCIAQKTIRVIRIREILLTRRLSFARIWPLVEDEYLAQPLQKEPPVSLGSLLMKYTTLRHGRNRTRPPATCRLAVEPLEDRAVPADLTVVMSGLDNPRGLAFGPEGALYVAEAGRGGDGPSIELRPGVSASYGPTGAVS